VRRSTVQLLLTWRSVVPFPPTERPRPARPFTPPGPHGRERARRSALARAATLPPRIRPVRAESRFLTAPPATQGPRARVSALAVWFERSENHVMANGKR